MEKILIEKQVWKSTHNRSMVLEAENKQLKELLGECLEVFGMVAGETIDFARSVDNCIDKIRQVLGEE